MISHEMLDTHTHNLFLLEREGVLPAEMHEWTWKMIEWLLEHRKEVMIEEAKVLAHRAGKKIE